MASGTGKPVRVRIVVNEDGTQTKTISYGKQNVQAKGRGAGRSGSYPRPHGNSVAPAATYRSRQGGQRGGGRGSGANRGRVGNQNRANRQPGPTTSPSGRGRGKLNGFAKRDEKAKKRLLAIEREQMSRLFYGPQIDVTHSKVGDDDNVSMERIVYSPNLAGIINSLIAHCCTNGSEVANSINGAYVGKFLFDLCKEEWFGQNHTYFLQSAPPEFWVAYSACRTKKVGRHTFLPIDDAVAYVAPSTQATGFPLGSRGGGTGNYIKVDTSLGSYTPALGWDQAKKLFEDAAGLVDSCTLAEYAGLPDDDASAFCSFIPDSGYSVADLLSYRANQTGAALPYVGNLFNVVPIRTHWVARLNLCRNDPSMGGTHVLKTRSTPSANMVLRLYKHWKHHSENHTIEPLFKFVDQTNIAQSICQIALRYQQLSAVNFLNQASFPINFNDLKIIVDIIIRRWCAKWLAIGCGAHVTWNGVKQRVMAAGTGQCIPRMGNQFLAPKIIEESLSGLGPFQRGNCYYFPVPFAYRDFPSFAAISFNATGLLTTTWNWLSNLNLGGEDIAVNDSVLSWSAFIINWNTCWASSNGSIPLSHSLDESGHNFSSLTMLVNDSGASGEGIFISQIFSQKMDDKISAMTERTFVPIFPTANGAATKKNAIQEYYQEGRELVFPPNSASMQDVHQSWVIETVSVGYRASNVDGQVDDHDSATLVTVLRDYLQDSTTFRTRMPANEDRRRAKLIESIKGSAVLGKIVSDLM